MKDICYKAIAILYRHLPLSKKYDLAIAFLIIRI